MAGIDLSAVFDAMPVACGLLTPDLEFITANRAYERLSGHSREQLAGRRLFDLFPGRSGEDAPVLRASLKRVVTEGEVDVIPLQRYDTEIAGRPGEYDERYWSVCNAPLIGPDGTVTAVINRIEEVTAYVRRVRTGHAGDDGSPAARMETVEAELFLRARELQEVNQRLRRARERERQATAAMREALRRQQQVVADTSHDLRGPLTGLQTRLQLALADPEADSRRILHAALHDADKLADIVADLLELARLEAGAPVGAEAVDLTRLVEEELHAHGDGVALVTRLEPGLTVDGSAVRLARLLGNLVSNAERHAAGRVEVRLAAEEGDAVLEVIDDGPGIPETEREAVFRRFYRRPDARRSDPEGTGLGLAIARQVAQAHRGSLHVADHPSGTRMVLRLPLCID